MPKEQRTFTKEFKLEAVPLVRRSGKSQAQIARDLGIADSTLQHWCQEFAEQGSQASPGSGHQTQQEEELRRIKRELEVTRQERDILKKALAIFSRSQGSFMITARCMAARGSMRSWQHSRRLAVCGGAPGSVFSSGGRLGDGPKQR